MTSAKFLIGMMFLIVLIFVGGQGVLEEGTGTAFAGDMAHFGGGHNAFDWGKWSVLVGEMGYLRKKMLSRSVIGCRLVP